ncbi:MAG: ATP-binding protein [Clostridiales bacterium]|nr:ATP-binding protein [Clostridiales bacterium]
MNIVSEAQVLSILRKYNPWWISKEEIKKLSKPQKRLAFYEALKTMCHESIRRFAVLSGARRVGKTTIMYQMIEALIEKGIPSRNIVYITLDNPIIKLVSVEEVISIYESVYPIEGKKYIFLDEIQYTDNWELWTKVLYDSRPDIRLTATGSASPVIERGAAESGTGRWSVLKVPTMSFYEYCQILQLSSLPQLPDKLNLTGLINLNSIELGNIMVGFEPLRQHFNRYLTIGGFPELVLSTDDIYAQRMLREDVVDKVIKRDIMTLFNIRSPLLMEKLFLYLCIKSSEIFSITTAARELENTSIPTIEGYIDALDKSNLIYQAKPLNIGGKAALKGKPKIYVADAAIRSAVLMTDDGLTDEKELGVIVETAVYKHLVSFYQSSPARLGYYRKAKDNQKEVDAVIELPQGKILCEVKYRTNSHIPQSDAIVELCNDPNAGVTNAFLLTKQLDDIGITKHNTAVPIFRIPTIAFLYILGKLEADGLNGKM